MEIAVIICSITVILIFITIVNVILYWKIDKLLKERLKSFKEIAKEQERMTSKESLDELNIILKTNNDDN